MKTNNTYNIQTLSFKAGKTIFLTDYDYTFKPKLLKESQITHPDIANPYYSCFSNFQKQGKDILDIYITTGRCQDARRSCTKILEDFDELEEANRPIIKGLIDNNGGSFFDIDKMGGKSVLVYNREYNKQRNKVRLKKSKKELGQNIKKDLDAMIELKKAKKNNDLVIVAGDGDNDKSFLNIFTYIKLPKNSKIPQDIENAKNLLKNKEIKNQIDALPIKILTVEGEVTKDDYYKYLLETFPNKYKYVKQDKKTGENTLFNTIKESIESYKKENKYFKKSLNRKIIKNKLNKPLLIILPMLVVLSAITGIFIYLKNKSNKRNVH